MTLKNNNIYILRDENKDIKNIDENDEINFKFISIQTIKNFIVDIITDKNSFILNKTSKYIDIIKK
jgi:hypothetical protein